MTSLSTEQGNPATIAALVNVCAAARRSAISMTKYRALDYLQEPWQLDMLRGGFAASLMTPGQQIEFGKQVLREESKAPFSIAPVKQINARAVILAGRYRRAIDGVRL
jgi:hypothetical protein